VLNPESTKISMPDGYAGRTITEDHCDKWIAYHVAMIISRGYDQLFRNKRIQVWEERKAYIRTHGPYEYRRDYDGNGLGLGTSTKKGL
jgi:hypothetical protein